MLLLSIGFKRLCTLLLALGILLQQLHFEGCCSRVRFWAGNIYCECFNDKLNNVNPSCLRYSPPSSPVGVNSSNEVYYLLELCAFLFP